METERLNKSIDLFNKFIKTPEGFQCNQTIKIASVRIQESVQFRTFENVIAAYSVIYDKLSDPQNKYTELKNLKTIEEVLNFF